MKQRLYTDRYEFLICVGLVFIMAAMGLGIEWYVYNTGQLKEHMTFF